MQFFPHKIVLFADTATRVALIINLVFARPKSWHPWFIFCLTDPKNKRSCFGSSSKVRYKLIGAVGTCWLIFLGEDQTIGAFCA